MTIQHASQNKDGGKLTSQMRIQIVKKYRDCCYELHRQRLSSYTNCRNIEMTCYYYLDTKALNFTGDLTAQFAVKSGSHAGTAATGTAGCNGTGYFVGMISKGDGKIVKEYNHPIQRFSPTWDTGFTRFALPNVVTTVLQTTSEQHHHAAG
jgi:hypothetical protein